MEKSEFPSVPKWHTPRRSERYFRKTSALILLPRERKVSRGFFFLFLRILVTSKTFGDFFSLSEKSEAVARLCLGI